MGQQRPAGGGAAGRLPPSRRQAGLAAHALRAAVPGAPASHRRGPALLYAQRPQQVTPHAHVVAHGRRQRVRLGRALRPHVPLRDPRRDFPPCALVVPAGAPGEGAVETELALVLAAPGLPPAPALLGLAGAGAAGRGVVAVHVGGGGGDVFELLRRCRNVCFRGDFHDAMRLGGMAGPSGGQQHHADMLLTGNWTR